VLGVGSKPQCIGRRALHLQCRCRLEAERRLAQCFVQPAVGKHDAATAQDAAPALAAAFAADAADLEDIGKVAGKCQGEREIDRLRTVVGERDPFAQRPVAQIDRAPDVDGVLEEDDPVILVEIRVREIDMEAEVVVPDR
jgi:hypothetical protein